MRKLLSLLVFCAVSASAVTNDVASNAVYIKGWKRTHLTYDLVSGAWSMPGFPDYVSAQTAAAMAKQIPGMYDWGLATVSTNLAPLQAMIAEERQRPVVMMTGASSLDNALDRQNLTMAVVSNELIRTSSNITVHAWVFSNSILTSEPVMEAAVVTDLGRCTNWVSGTWSNYGDERYAVDVELADNETLEAYRCDFHIPLDWTGDLVCEVMRWCRVGTPADGFNVGNRRVRVNRKMTMHTNDVSWVYAEMHTKGGYDILHRYTPFIDNGLLKFGEKEEEEEPEEND